LTARVPDSLEPSDARAAVLDRRMRERLGTSLRHILSQAADTLALDASMLDGFFQRLKTSPVAPPIFGAYFELVLALENGSVTDARELLHEIAAASEPPGGTLITDFAETGATGRYRRLMDSDPATPFEFFPPPHEPAQRSRQLIAEAFVLMDRGDAGLAREIRVLLREIVLAAGPESKQAMTFHGASSFMLWGAIVLNVRAHDTALDMVQALAHESGHTLLFGLCADCALVEDGGAARYPSPLREDERPMDGIVHATFVSARMHRAVARLVESGVLSEDETAAARGALADHSRNFHSGFDTVDRHARLTPLGRAVMADARRYMTSGG
jgi:hypothetical protein